MAKYKAGDKITHGRVELVVVKGDCKNCYFSAPHGCMAKFTEGCASTLGYDLICIISEGGI